MATYPESTLLFENSEVTVRALSVSEMDNSVYLLTILATGEQMLIDPADMDFSFELFAHVTKFFNYKVR